MRSKFCIAATMVSLAGCGHGAVKGPVMQEMSEVHRDSSTLCDPPMSVFYHHTVRANRDVAASIPYLPPFASHMSRVLMSNTEIEAQVRQMAEGIYDQMGDQEVQLLGVLQGAINFQQALARQLEVVAAERYAATETEWRLQNPKTELTRQIRESLGKKNMFVPRLVRTQSYKNESSTGKVDVTLFGQSSTWITNKIVMVVEDIVDHGKTAEALIYELRQLKPKEVHFVSLFEKRSRHELRGLDSYRVGIEIPDEFVVGFGLDYNQRYRNYPHLGILNEEARKKYHV